MTAVDVRPGAGYLGSWRVAFRLARRGAVRRRAASFLIVATLAVPVFAAAVLAQVWAATYNSADRQTSWAIGQADLRLGGTDLDKAVATLPGGSTVAPLTNGATIISHAGAFTLADYIATDTASPIVDGMFVVRSGHEPASGSEVALSSALAAALRLRVGDSIEAGRPTQRYTIVGIVDTSNSLSARVIVCPAASPLARTGGRTALVDLPVGGSWGPHGVTDLSYADRASVAPTLAAQAAQAAGLTVIVGFAFVQFILLAAAAFTAIARQQRRDLAVAAAVGATRRQAARMILGSGVVLGGAGGAVGIGIALIVFTSSRNLLERAVNHPLAHAGIPTGYLAMVLLASVAAGAAAALGPARAATREPLRRAGSATVGGGARSGRMAAAGASAIAVGVAVTLYGVRPSVASSTSVAAGAATALAGLVLCLPLLIGALGRLGNRVSLIPRLAVRHSARQPTRTAAAVAAVCAATAGSVGILLFAGADTSTGVAAQPLARTGQILVPASVAASLRPADLAALRDDLAATSVVTVELASATPVFVSMDPTQPPPDLSGTVAVGGADLIRTVTGHAPGADAITSLDQGHAVVFYPQLIRDAQVRLQTGGDTAVTLPGFLEAADDNYRRLPSAVISPATAHRLALKLTPGGLIIDPAAALDPHQIANANSVVLGAQIRDLGNTAPPQGLTIVDEPAAAGSSSPLLYVLAGVSILVTLVASTVAVSLAIAEMRDDLSTLAAIGASPRVHRLLGAAQAAIVVGIGTTLGAIIAFMPAAGLVALRSDLHWHVSWWPLVAVIAAAPLIAIAATMAFTRPNPALTRRLL